MSFKIPSYCLLIFFFSACEGNRKLKENRVKRIDSLLAVVNQKQNELSNSDTTSISKAVAKFNNYFIFLSDRLNDTISKTEADDIQMFKISGENLGKIKYNAQVLNNRILFVKKRLVNLRQATVQEDLSGELITKFVENECMQVSTISQQINAHQKQHAVNLSALVSALPGIEEVIKQHNFGILPSIITRSVSL